MTLSLTKMAKEIVLKVHTIVWTCFPVKFRLKVTDPPRAPTISFRVPEVFAVTADTENHSVSACHKLPQPLSPWKILWHNFKFSRSRTSSTLRWHWEQTLLPARSSATTTPPHHILRDPSGVVQTVVNLKSQLHPWQVPVVGGGEERQLKKFLSGSLRKTRLLQRCLAWSWWDRLPKPGSVVHKHKQGNGRRAVCRDNNSGHV